MSKKAESDVEENYVVKQEVRISWESGRERSGGQMQSSFPSLRRFSVQLVEWQKLWKCEKDYTFLFLPSIPSCPCLHACAGRIFQEADCTRLSEHARFVQIQYLATLWEVLFLTAKFITDKKGILNRVYCISYYQWLNLLLVIITLALKNSNKQYIKSNMSIWFA